MDIKFKDEVRVDKIVSLCYVCKKKNNKYICPKCSIPYCSLRCYKSHSSECLEEFYKEHVIENLKIRKSTSDEKKKLIEMVNKADETPDLVMEDIQEDMMLKRFNEILKLADQDNFIDGLTEKEKNGFLEFINSGKAIKYVKEWIPWWIDLSTDYFIEISSNQFYQTSPPIEKLCKSPSSFLLIHCIELIFHTVFSFRAFNGEIDENQEEILRLLMKNSKVLKSTAKGQEFESINSVLYLSSQAIIQSEPSIALGLIVPVTHDCHLILKSKWKTLKFILEILDFFEKIRLKNFFYSKSNKNLKMISKKIEFFVSYLKSQELEKFESAAEEILLFSESYNELMGKDNMESIKKV